VIDQLFVRQHSDGRILVYVVLEPGADEVVATVAGEVLPTAGSDAASAVWRIARRYSMPDSAAEEGAAVASV
jgi:hypothetical protein